MRLNANHDDPDRTRHMKPPFFAIGSPRSVTTYRAINERTPFSKLTSGAITARAQIFDFPTTSESGSSRGQVHCWPTMEYPA